jgi:trigger factor
MKSTVESVSSVKKKLHIQVDQETVAAEFGKAVSDVAKSAKVPGFRPGKAPRAVVERHYAGEIESEVMNRLISEAYLGTLKEHNLTAVDVPSIANMSPFAKNAPLNFTAVVEVRPEIALGNYDGIEVKEADLNVSDEELNQTIDRLREMYAQLEVVEGRPLAKDDTAIIDFEGFRDGKSVSGAKASDYVLSLGTGSLIPGFEDQLIGMQKGETREISVKFPDDYQSAELAGKDVKFTVTLKEVKKKVLPEMNDEFAKDIGNNKTVAELKADIKKDIEARKKDEQAQTQRETLLSKLVDEHTFDVPQGMLDRELQSMARTQATRMARRGVDVKSFDVAKFAEENKQLAEKRVKGMLLLDVIAEKEKIEVSEQEVNQAMATMARSAGQTVEAIKSYYESQESGTDGLRESLAREKTLGLLLSRAKKSYN